MMLLVFLMLLFGGLLLNILALWCCKLTILRH